jgi:hypothetical protein
VIQSNNDVQLYTYDVYYVTPAILAATFVSILECREWIEFN